MAYVTRTELRTYIGITGTSHDSILDNFIEAASEACDLHTGRVQGALGAGFLTHSNTNERHWITNEARVVLEEWPVVSITSATLRGSAIVEGTDFYLRDGPGIMTFFEGSSYKKQESGPVAISYIAGYTTVPERVKTCCFRVGAYWFARKGAEGLGAQLIGDMQETFRIPEVKRILEEELSDFTLDFIGIRGV